MHVIATSFIYLMVWGLLCYFVICRIQQCAVSSDSEAVYSVLAELHKKGLLCDGLRVNWGRAWHGLVLWSNQGSVWLGLNM